MGDHAACEKEINRLVVSVYSNPVIQALYSENWERGKLTASSNINNTNAPEHNTCMHTHTHPHTRLEIAYLVVEAADNHNLGIFQQLKVSSWHCRQSLVLIHKHLNFHSSL